jgi:2-polyprenyl-3-methyl-5-hydroxy-6-metoxy-1,4-benzoquinol methylase
MTTVKGAVKELISDRLLRRQMGHHPGELTPDDERVLAVVRKSVPTDEFTISQFLLGSRYWGDRLDRVFGARSTMIDVGCGGGNWVLAAARQGRSVLGVDLHEARLACARAVMEAEGPNVGTARLVAASGTELPLPDGSTSAILCFNVLTVMGVPIGTVLKEFRRVAAENARVYVTVTGPGYVAYLTVQSLLRPSLVRLYSLLHVYVRTLLYLLGLRPQPHAWTTRAVFHAAAEKSGWMILHEGDEGTITREIQAPVFRPRFLGLPFMREYVLAVRGPADESSRGIGALEQLADNAAGRLSDVSYWDSILAAAVLPRENSRMVYNYRLMMDFVERFLRPLAGRSFLEIGCGSSGWLPYFARTYGFTVSGVDYSEVGCRLAQENLRMLQIPYGEIVCSDVFAWNTDRRYAVVFTYGVVEHFENPAELVSVCRRLCEPGGVVVTLVPNLRGIVGLLSRIFVPEIYAMHRVLTRTELARMHELCGLSVLRCEYVGNFTLGLIPWTKSGHWFFRAGTRRREFCLKVMWVFDRNIGRLWNLLGVQLKTPLWSPYVIAVAANSDTVAPGRSGGMSGQYTGGGQ